MPSQELLVLVDTPNETLGVEYKSWLDLDDNETRADLARHIAAIANHGGGYIVFGFDDKTLQPIPNASSFKITHDTITSVVKKYLDASKFQPQGKRQNILGAIAFDKNRFSEQTALYRVIIYSDGKLIDAGLEPGVSEQQQLKVLIDKYPASFSAADVSVFGLASANENETSLEARERIFSAFFLNSWSHLKSFSSSLPQQSNGLFPAASRLDGVFDGGGAQGSAKLVITTPQEGLHAEGRLAFNIGRAILYVPYDGEYQYENGDCKLIATATESVPPLSTTSYFRKGDKLSLHGKSLAALEGTLQAGAKEVFKDGTQEVKYNLKFTKP